jgi:hypothetical protein
MLNWALRVLRFLGGYTEFVYVFAGTLVWESVTKTKLSDGALWSLYAGAFVWLSFWNWHKATARAEAAEKKQPATQSPRRVFVETPEAVIPLLTDRSSLNLRTFTQMTPYIEKWIAVSGTVEGVADSLVDDGIHLSLIVGNGQRVNLRFPGAERSRLGNLLKGQYVTAIGQIPLFWSSVALENAGLIRVGPFRATLARAS